MKRIAIVSLGKGVGKTTVALNLGMALHKLGAKTVVFDMGFDKPNFQEHLDMEIVPVEIDKVLSEEKHINDAICRHVSGLGIVPMIPLSATDPENNFRKVFMHIPYVDGEYMIIDASSNPEMMIHTLKNSDEALIVHSPYYTSKIIDDVSSMITKAGAFNLGIIMNRSHPDSVKDIFGKPVIEHIPENVHLQKAFMNKDIAFQLYPNSGPSRIFMRIAERLRN